jgi:hypothetical protein
MVTRRFQRDYQNLNLHTDKTMVTRRYQRDYQNLTLHKTIQWSQEDTKEIIKTLIYTRQYNGHKKIPKRLLEPKFTQDNTMVTRRHQRDYQNINLHTDNTMVIRRYQRDYQNLNLQNTIQWSQEDTKEIIRS